MKFLNDKRIIIGVISGLLVIVALSVSLFFNFYHDKNEIKSEDLKLSLVEDEKSNEDINKEVWYVEVKGAVKKPGVYEVTSENIINDVIKKAGGFKSNAYSNNINLSKKVSNEMVIYVYTKSGYKKKNEVSLDECVCNNYDLSNCLDSNTSIIVSNNSSNNDKVESNNDIEDNNQININTASLSEFANLPGLGESKAQAIIDYRNQNGNFKSIEEIKNVSGIGEKTYEKFKGLIMV